MAKKLELFYFDSCPFCQIVLRAIDELNIELEYKNIMEDRESLERLMKDTGRRTVPCLYIDNQPMFESADIIAWLQSNASDLKTKN